MVPPGPTGLSACSSPRVDGAIVRMLRDDVDGALEAGDEGGGDGVESLVVGSWVASALESWVLSFDGD